VTDRFGTRAELRSCVKVHTLQRTTHEEPATDEKGQPVLDEKDQPKVRHPALKEQVLAVGPAASQAIIKQVGTNGGGFFNGISSHPFENATPFWNFIELLSILLLPTALGYTFDVMVKDTWRGWATLAGTTLSVPLLAFCGGSEQSGNPAFSRAELDVSAGGLQAGGNMEAQEVRFGVARSARWCIAASAPVSTACGNALSSPASARA
jgi:K+-transporting ATPase ATPase A chain